MEGLKHKYSIRKTNGNRIQSDAKYFVLRYDALHTESIENSAHRAASRRALLLYADLIEAVNVKLADDIRKDVEKENKQLDNLSNL